MQQAPHRRSQCTFGGVSVPSETRVQVQDRNPNLFFTLLNGGLYARVGFSWGPMIEKYVCFIQFHDEMRNELVRMWGKSNCAHCALPPLLFDRV